MLALDCCAKGDTETAEQEMGEQVEVEAID